MENDFLNPWLSVWLQPRKTLRQISENNPERYTLLIFALYWILFTIIGSFPGWGRMPYGVMISMGLVGGAVFGLLVGYLSSGLIYITGKWLGGEANFSLVKAVVAWSYMPNFAALIFLAVAGLSNGGGANGPTVISLLCGLMLLVFGIWSLVIQVAGLAEIQEFTYGRAIANLLLAAAIIFIPVLIVVALVGYAALSALSGLH